MVPPLPLLALIFSVLVVVPLILKIQPGSRLGTAAAARVRSGASLPSAGAVSLAGVGLVFAHKLSVLRALSLLPFSQGAL